MNKLDLLAAALSLIACLWATGPQIGALEGQYWPVTTEAVLVSGAADPPPDHRSIWEHTATKLRECNWVRTQWYVGPRDAGVPVRTEYSGPPNVNAVGDLHWDDLRIWAFAEDVQTYSYAYVYHQCPHRWYETRTLFYVGEPDGEIRR